MAKQFYSMSETTAKLGVTEDQVKGLVRDGRLREIRDAGKLLFRVDEVDRIASKEGSSIVDLAVTGDARSADIGLSGSDVITLESADEDRPRKPKEDTKITSVGISVFDDDELEIDADPLAETRITAAQGVDEAPIGGAGSGSGLMDLTRESDDTSLGAELLDVISPSEGTETAAQAEREIGETVTETAQASMDAGFGMDMGAPISAGPPVASGDPTGPVFTGLMAATVLILGLAGLVGASAIQGLSLGFLETIANGSNLYIYPLGGSAALAIIAAGVGMLIGRSNAPRRPAAAPAGGGRVKMR